MTNNEYLGLNIWPKTSNQSTNTKNMIFIKWYKEVMK